MDGSDKLPLFVIGKSAKPRCFRGVKSLPTEYESNKKAWMTGEMFSRWLVRLDKKMQRNGRKIAMIVDNCPAHPTLKGLKVIELIFLPPNTTSQTQPMDQDVINNLKSHYKRLVIMKQLHTADKNTDVLITVLDAMYLMQQSWRKVTRKTIANCFRHAKFVPSSNGDSTENEDDDDEPDDDLPLARLAELGIRDIQRFIHADLDIPTCTLMTDDDILEDVLLERNPDAENDDEMNDKMVGGSEQNIKEPSVTEAFEACNTLRVYFQTKAHSEFVLDQIGFVHNELVKDYFKNRCAKQAVITDFFKK
ncbi:tigger transposable element-derived protein 4-like [Gigantopelta aegis]|uniref:tigger transposable element-derived protein 4-like n=1 Tax=Gigantopelta aegis TaxID=1735272 RepID=UPI001B88E719|nr:tigger transposable element-derived protein 4-like [Gigantopelta aegis]